MESWIFTLGEYRLFLNPITGRWYYFDRAHDDWKDINAPAGSVIFSLKGADLEMTKTGAGTTEPGPAGTAGEKCGVSVPVRRPVETRSEVLQQLRSKNQLIPLFSAPAET